MEIEFYSLENFGSELKVMLLKEQTFISRG